MTEPDLPNSIGQRLLLRARRVRQAFGTPAALTMFFFGFACGLPFLLVGYTLSTWLRDIGISLGVIGLVSYATLAYTLKFLWAPVLDRWSLPGFAGMGRRRSWLMGSQLILLIALLGIAKFGPEASLAVFVLFVTLAAVAGATQDTAVDAYRIEIAPIEAQAALAATYTLGYRFALICSGAGALYLAEYASWETAYLSMVALLALAMLATVFAREPALREQDRLAEGRTLRETFAGPFLEFFRRNGWIVGLVLLAFVGLYKLPDQMLGVLAGPFYIDTGFSKAEIATVSKVYGIWMGIGGAFAGGIAVAAFGLRGNLVAAAIGVALSNLLFIVMSLHPGELWAFVLTISGDNFAQGFAGVVLVAFLSGLVNRAYTATQYALLVSLANMPGKLIGGVSGFIVEASSYTHFFVFSTLSVVPALLALAWLWPRFSKRPAA